MHHSPHLTPVQVEALSRLCLMIDSDKVIRTWFHSLENLPCNLRANAIIEITTQMRRNDEDPDLIGAICCISDTDVYNAAIVAVRELES